MSTGQLTIEYICECCMAGPCRALVPDDGGPAPDCCLYGGGTKEWTEVEGSVLDYDEPEEDTSDE